MAIFSNYIYLHICMYSWAQKTLQEHWNDPRERLYSLEQLEASLTYDPLWNAAQTEMVRIFVAVVVYIFKTAL